MICESDILWIILTCLIRLYVMIQPLVIVFFLLLLLMFRILLKKLLLLIFFPNIHVTINRLETRQGNLTIYD